ncbi:MAG: prolyl oligopeptidase family serine peptidase [Pseudomonadota bacterium]
MTRAHAVVSAIALLSSVAGIACSSSSSPSATEGGSPGSSGAAQGGASGGNAQPGSGGAATGQSGSASGGAAVMAGGAGAGTSSGGAGTTGTTGGDGGTAGKAGSGSGGAAGAGTGGAGTGGATGTDVDKSGGCGNPKTLQNGTLNIMSGGASRKYILRVPDNYVNTQPYRLVFAFAESGSSATSVADRNYFTMATLDTKKGTIFVAPDAANGMGSWSKTDVDLTDAILKVVEDDLCIDKKRIFATGFSFGGAMSIAIACTRADVFRGVAFFSGADLTGSCPATLTKPIAYYASQASGDSSGTPMPSSGKVKQAEFAAVNGCMPEPNALTFPASGQAHTCTEYKGCSAGHPTRYCVFDGPHGWEPKDPGQAMSWDAPEAWKFITQF